MDIKALVKYLFFLPYLGGVLAIISMITPVAAHFHKDIYNPSHTIWIWGLIVITEWVYGFTGYAWENEFTLITDPFILIISIIISILIAFFAIKTIITSRNYGRDEKRLDMTFVKYGACILGLYILWMMILQIFYALTGFMGMGPEFSFWTYFHVNFGTVGIFLGGFFIILGPILSKAFLKRFYYLFVE